MGGRAPPGEPSAGARPPRSATRTVVALMIDSVIVSAITVTMMAGITAASTFEGANTGARHASLIPLRFSVYR